MTLSVSIWRTSRLRVAPSANRVAIFSFRRPDARATRRFATFEQATSSTISAAPSPSRDANRIVPRGNQKGLSNCVPAGIATAPCRRAGPALLAAQLPRKCRGPRLRFANPQPRRHAADQEQPGIGRLLQEIAAARHHLCVTHQRHPHLRPYPIRRVPWNPGGATPITVKGCPLI